MHEHQEVVEQPTKNFFAKWIGVYFSPGETFKSIDQKPDWILPLLLTALITIVFVILIGPYTQDATIEAMMDRGMTEDQAYETLESPFMKYINPILGGVGALIVGFIIAGLFYLVFSFILGGESTYKKVLSVYAYIGFAVGFVTMLIKLPLMIAKGSFKVQTSLAAFLPIDMEEQFLYKLFAHFDVFMIWELILFTIGFGIIYKFSRGKAATGVISLWAIYVIGAILLSNLFGSFGG